MVSIKHRRQDLGLLPARPCRLTVTFASAEHRRPLVSAKLYSSPTEARSVTKVPTSSDNRMCDTYQKSLCDSQRPQVKYATCSAHWCSLHVIIFVTVYKMQCGNFRIIGGSTPTLNVFNPLVVLVYLSWDVTPTDRKNVNTWGASTLPRPHSRLERGEASPFPSPSTLSASRSLAAFGASLLTP